MAKTDIELGMQVHEHLKELGIENPIAFHKAASANQPLMENAMDDFCTELGLDLKHPSTCGTPHRLAKMYKNEICWGLDYSRFPHCMKTPLEGQRDIVLVKNIEVKSLCEHHFMPVLGVAHVAYIPNEHNLGLSKLNRIVEFFGRRPQLQERLGAQIAAALQLILDTEDVAVIVDAEHLCVKFRGIQDHSSSTTSSHMRGKFLDNTAARAELLQLIKG